jgi:hypothetical protein
MRASLGNPLLPPVFFHCTALINILNKKGLMSGIYAFLITAGLLFTIFMLLFFRLAALFLLVFI